MRILRFILSVILCLSLLSSSAANVFAAATVNTTTTQGNTTTEQTKEYKVLILDKAKLLTPEEKAKLAIDMKELQPYGNVVFLTITLKKGANYEKFSQDVYYKLYGNEPGVIFQIDMGNRKLTLSSSTGMDELISSERDSIVDNIYELATQKKYYECAKKCFHQIKLVIDNEEIAHDMKHINNAIFALILGLILNFLIICATARRRISKKKLLGEMGTAAILTDIVITAGHVTKTYSPKSSGSSGGGGGSSSSGGSSGGGGFSGGSSSHGF